MNSRSFYKFKLSLLLIDTILSYMNFKNKIYPASCSESVLFALFLSIASFFDFSQQLHIKIFMIAIAFSSIYTNVSILVSLLKRLQIGPYAFYLIVSHYFSRQYIQSHTIQQLTLYFESYLNICFFSIYFRSIRISRVQVSYLN